MVIDPNVLALVNGSLIVFLLGNILGAVIWLTRLGSAVAALSRDIVKLGLEISRIDHEGTKEMNLIKYRQGVLDRLTILEKHNGGFIATKN